MSGVFNEVLVINCERITIKYRLLFINLFGLLIDTHKSQIMNYSFTPRV